MLENPELPERNIASSTVQAPVFEGETYERRRLELRSAPTTTDYSKAASRGNGVDDLPQEGGWLPPKPSTTTWDDDSEKESALLVDEQEEEAPKDIREQLMTCPPPVANDGTLFEKDVEKPGAGRNAGRSMTLSRLTALSAPRQIELKYSAPVHRPSTVNPADMGKINAVDWLNVNSRMDAPFPRTASRVPSFYDTIDRESNADLKAQGTMRQRVLDSVTLPRPPQIPESHRTRSAAATIRPKVSNAWNQLTSSVRALEGSEVWAWVHSEEGMQQVLQAMHVSTRRLHDAAAGDAQKQRHIRDEWVRAHYYYFPDMRHDRRLQGYEVHPTSQ
jgi:hypothetical protein